MNDRRPTRRYLLVLLATLWPGAVYAESPWFPIGGSLFPKLLADPEEVQTKGQYFRSQGQDMIDFSVGNNWGIRRWQAGQRSNWPLQLDLSGVIIPRFRINDMVEMQAVDYLVNLPMEARHDIYSARISLFHKSAHLGDNLIEQTGQKRIGYSREGIQTLFAVEPLRYVRIYAGETQLLHTIPDLGRTTVQGGVELRSAPWRGSDGAEWFLYLAQDEQCKEEINWDVNSDTQLGMSLGFAGNPRRFRVYANYFNGHSTFGQFYTQKESLISVGIGLDF